MNILVSACLLGIGCRYDGKCKPNEDVIKLSEVYSLVPFCPEIYGGLPTPRIPSEIVGEKVLNAEGEDVTKQYSKGAEETLKTAKMFGCEVAIMKEKSPSCGNGLIHNGKFDGGLIEGDGITVRLLKKNGIKVFGESEIESIKAYPNLV